MSFCVANPSPAEHYSPMSHHDNEWLPTRASLLGRLKNWDDQVSWQQFFDSYGRLIYGVARKSGLSDAEAQDVVQETMSSVAKHMPSFRYDPAVGSFKAWLLNLTRWRIKDQARKRAPTHGVSSDAEPDTTTALDMVDNLIDPASLEMDRVWEIEWEKNLLAAALAQVKRHLDPAKYQIFDFYVNKEWEAEKVSQTFNVAVQQVYLIKHRVTEMLKEEIQRLDRNPM